MNLKWKRKKKKRGKDQKQNKVKMHQISDRKTRTTKIVTKNPLQTVIA